MNVAMTVLGAADHGRGRLVASRFDAEDDHCCMIPTKKK
jgi:hypothetical protein